MQFKSNADRHASLLKWFKASWSHTKVYLENQLIFLPVQLEPDQHYMWT